MLPVLEGKPRAHGHNRPLSARSARFGGGARPQARSAEDGRVGAALSFLAQPTATNPHLGSVDKTETTYTLSRARGQNNEWTVTLETKSDGGRDDTVQFDSLG